MSGEVIGPHGVSPVARGRTWLPGRVRASIAAAGCAAIAGGLAWAVWPGSVRGPDRTATPGGEWNMGQALPEHPLVVAAPSPAPAPTPSAPPTVPPPSATAVPAPPQTLGFWEDTNGARELAGQIRARTAAASPDGGAATGADPDVAAPGAGGEYAQRMRTTSFADAAPVPRPFHVHYTIKKGTIFPCTPAQPISSSLPGPVRCTADQDVWSMDGTTILLPRGTQVNGTVEHGLASGEERLFLVWTDALTPRPDLLPIPLDGPAADELGQTGAPGDVDDHLWKRIKTALLLSAVEFVGNAGTAALEQGRSNVYLNAGGIANSGNTLAQMAFGRDLNIPPTLYRGPGQPLTVYVNHYVDLFHFYQDRVR
jgi:type IV secretory pathway VirB10-like protein